MEYNALSTKEIVKATVLHLKDNGIEGIVVENAAAALEKIKELIPQGASLMNGSSKTLEQIGFVDYLKEGKHGWNNLHDAILIEKDPLKQAVLRKQAVLSDYYLGSVHALCENGQFIIASNTGSQLPHIVFTSPNLIFVVGAQKIVPSIQEAINRLQEHVVPLEDVNMQQKYGINTQISKLLIFKKENPVIGRKVRMIIVNEILGF